MRLAVKGCLTQLGLLGGVVIWYQRRRVKREVKCYRDQLIKWQRQVKNSTERSARRHHLLLSQPARDRPTPLLYQSTGIETRFTNGLDRDLKSRRTFTFHQAATLAEWIGSGPYVSGELAAEARATDPLGIALRNGRISSLEIWASGPFTRSMGTGGAAICKLDTLVR